MVLAAVNSTETVTTNTKIVDCTFDHVHVCVSDLDYVGLCVPGVLVVERPVARRDLLQLVEEVSDDLVQGQLELHLGPVFGVIQVI